MLQCNFICVEDPNSDGDIAHEDIHRLLLQAPTGFVPKYGICDFVYNRYSIIHWY